MSVQPYVKACASVWCRVGVSVRWFVYYSTLATLLGIQTQTEDRSTHFPLTACLSLGACSSSTWLHPVTTFSTQIHPPLYDSLTPPSLLCVIFRGLKVKMENYSETTTTFLTSFLYNCSPSTGPSSISSINKKKRLLSPGCNQWDCLSYTAAFCPAFLTA